MELIIYPLLGTKSQRLMRKRWRKLRHGVRSPYKYLPQRRLINRLMEELGYTEEQVIKQLYDERLYLLRDDWGQNEINANEV